MLRVEFWKIKALIELELKLLGIVNLGTDMLLFEFVNLQYDYAK